MKFTELVQEEFIEDNLVANSKEDAIANMAEVLFQKGYVNEYFSEAILQRERKHPSGLPMGEINIAIPHTDAIFVKKSVLYFARLHRLLEFKVMGSPDEIIPVQFISMFALKEKKRIGDLLETLITIYQQKEVLQSLLQAKNAREIFDILKKHVMNEQTESATNA